MPFYTVVYSRKHSRQNFSFSHHNLTTIKKKFPKSLSISSMSKFEEISNNNNWEIKNAPLLVLITGSTTELYTSLSCKSQQSGNTLQRISSDTSLHKFLHGGLSEIDQNFIPISFLSTLAFYSKGNKHDWRAATIVPFLSNWTVLPRSITKKNIKHIIMIISKCIIKTLKDSILFADCVKFRELDILQQVQNHSKPK